ncbi:site-specific integrase [Gordonia sp. NB41Y]|uniref:tyrosine-type recombinase/integrase n=1 Tax=Gordonia sp. NB41Y TaxID=875808 RepID=UPI0002BD5053|nr:site-specific integrase [Gordonia sp. NB41Y]EMP13514.1 integrase [Gordonia sp. NB41Y]WLP91438.1 tyrosine-type recombinase/integrase [Gordonia sp. NB41Y]
MAGKPGRRGWGYIRKLPSGRFRAEYTGPDLQRHAAPTTYSTRTDAEGWLASERRKIELDVWEPPRLAKEKARAQSVTVTTYAEKWIAERKLKPGTRAIYTSVLKNHITPILGTVPLRNLSAPAVRAWFAGLGTDHPRRNSHAYGLLHAVCATAVADDLIRSNPCSIPNAMNPPRKRDPIILDVPEVASLADAIRPERLRALILLSAWCGVRWGEVSELRRKDITKGCESVNVTRAVARREGEYLVATTKSGKGRSVVVPPHIREDIQRHLDTHVDSGPDSLLFPAFRGGHMNGRTFQREYFDPAAESIGRKGLRPHDLRHFAGTQAARVGNLVETMGRLGHSTVKASLIYQQIVSGRDAEVAAALSKLAQTPQEDDDDE